MSISNHQVRLAARPVGMPKRSDFKFTEEPVRDLKPGEVLVKIQYISLDPAMRGWMNEGRSYVPPIGIGEVMRAGAAGRVIASKNDRFAVGDAVTGGLGVQEYAISDGTGLIKVDTKVAPLPVYFGTLGMPGMTAYFGLLDVGQPKAGETVVVSAAAGAVGSVVGQIAKIKGCRAIGIAGGKEKCRYVVEELGFDAAVDYKHEPWSETLRKHCPKGIDVYFDNVGGEILDAALALLARAAPEFRSAARSRSTTARRSRARRIILSLLINRATDAGLHRLRLCGSLQRGGRGDGRLDDGGQAQEPRGHRSGARDLSRNAAQALYRRE